MWSFTILHITLRVLKGELLFSDPRTGLYTTLWSGTGQLLSSTSSFASMDADALREWSWRNSTSFLRRETSLVEAKEKRIEGFTEGRSSKQEKKQYRAISSLARNCRNDPHFGHHTSQNIVLFGTPYLRALKRVVNIWGTQCMTHQPWCVHKRTHP